MAAPENKKSKAGRIAIIVGIAVVLITVFGILIRSADARPTQPLHQQSS